MLRTRASLALFLAVSATTSIAQDEIASTRDTTSSVRPVALHPHPVTSFGAARLGDHVYTVGGYFGKPHDYSREFQESKLRRMSVADGAWEELSDVGGIQGLALVAQGERVVRIGGLRILNVDGEPSELLSVDEVASFDPSTGKWTDLPPLPAPRSSHMAAMIGDEVWVAGGWKLDPENAPEWHDTLAVLDLGDPASGWREISVPFERRAVGVAAVHQRLFVLGGIAERKTSRQLDLYDTCTGVWSRGPDFPQNAFGVAAVGLGDAVYASGADGVLWRLPAETGEWQALSSHLFPRFFHQLVPSEEDRLLCLGGIAGGKRTAHVESIAVDGTGLHAWTFWKLPFEGRARTDLDVLHGGDEVFVLGGRDGSGEPVDSAWRLNLGTFEVTPAGQLPATPGTLEAAWMGGGVALALGSSKGEADTPSAWTFDAETDLWFPLGEMVPAGSAHGPVVREGDGYLVLGAGEGRDVLRWNGPDQEEERFLPTGISLPRAREAFGHARFGNSIVLVGGVDTAGEGVDVCDVLDLTTWTWSTLPAPRTSRMEPDVVAVDDDLYVLGGGPGIERYDGELGRWEVFLEALPVELAEVHGFAYRDRLWILGTPSEEGAILLGLVELGRRPAVTSSTSHP